MKVTVIGTGYVGLVTGAIFSMQGHDVCCVDIDKSKIDGLRRGVLPIYEPGLEEVVEMGVAHGKLQFTTNVKSAAGADVIFLAVGTPQTASGSANLEHLESAAESIAPHVKKGAVVVIKSTVPVGTNLRIAELVKQQCGYHVDIASNPEFLKEGTAVEDCLNPNRIVLGVRNKRVSDVLQHLYSPLVNSMDESCEMLVMDPESAEMTKYTANSFLAMKISFINEIANMCEKLGADVEEVRAGICSDKRIGWDFLKPGVGYGGSCFPKDVRALISQADDVGASSELLQTVDSVNERQKGVMADKILQHFNGDVKGKRIAVWGLAFKPGTDDIRESPSINLIQTLQSNGAKIIAHDPQAAENMRSKLGDETQYVDAKYDAIWFADALVVMTDWDEYLDIDPSKLSLQLKPNAAVFDGRNCQNRDHFSIANFNYHSIGQSPLKPAELWDVAPEQVETETRNRRDLAWL